MAHVVERKQIYINGTWVPSSGADVIEVLNPATETLMATVPRGTGADVDKAVKAAAAALESWSLTSIDERALIFGKMAELLAARAGEVTDMLTRELGQPRTAVAERTYGSAVTDLRLIVDSLSEVSWEEKVGHSVVRKVPAGVVAAISAWNSPLKLIIMKAGAAMAAGCTVVLKGPEVAPLSSFLFAELADEAGFPPGVLNLVSGLGTEVGESLTSHPLVDMISLTGSVRAGSRVMEVASKGIKRVALELGGKSANVILPDADLQEAVTVGLHDAFRNSGQVCGGLTRVLVPRDRLAEAETLAAKVAESYVPGDPFDPESTLGTVANALQRERVREKIQAGIDEGVTLVTGGVDAPQGLDRGYYVRPTIFSGDNSNVIAREEIFGPVVILIPYEDEQDAIAIANDSDYGLAGAVWAADPQHARQVAGRLRTGRVRINGAPLDQQAPHGGFGLSGIGREWGRYGIEEFLDYQSVTG
jgi:aldehyde dehydrogenase (NAD+)